MHILFVIITLFFLPLQLFAAEDATRSYLRAQPLDAWVAMARGAIGDPVELRALAVLSRAGVFDLSKFILAVVANGGDPRTVAGSDVIAALLAEVKEDQIGSPKALNDDAWGILALAAGGIGNDHPAIRGVTKTLRAHQNADGGWSYVKGESSDTNDTAAVVMALLEAGVGSSDAVIQRALAYFANQQNDDGGYSFDRSQFLASDGASDAWVLSALAKAGDALRDRQKNGVTVADHLRSLQRADGSYAWQRGTTKGSLGVTTSAAIALVGKWFPLVSDSAAPPSADTLRCRGRSPCSARGPLRWPIAASDTPSPPRSSVPSTRPLLSVEEKIADSVIVPSGFVFPSLVATSVFSRPERRIVVAASPKDLTPRSQSSRALALARGKPSLSLQEKGRDSDGDGYPDDVEIANGYDPHDPRPVKKVKSKVKSQKLKVKMKKSK